MKRVAVINDICGLGRCSLAAALPVLSVLGHQCCAAPTAVLTNQTGYDSYALLDCELLLRRFPEEWRKRGLRLDAICAGFFASPGQVAATRELIDTFRLPDTLLLVDPVLGDRGKLYPVVDSPLQEAIAALAREADVLTPNVTEACILTGEDWAIFESGDTDAQFACLHRMGMALLANGAKIVCITGWRRRSPGGARNEVCTLAFQENACSVFASPAVAGSYSGTGDLFAAALCGLLLQGVALDDAVRRTIRFLEASLNAAAEEGAPGADGVPFEGYLGMLMG